MRADPERANLLHTRGLQLQLRRAGKIDMGPAMRAGGHNAGMSRCRNLICDIVTDLVAAQSDSWTDPGAETGRVTQDADRAADDTRSQTPPAGMYDGQTSLIGDDQREAVCGGDAEDKISPSCPQSISWSAVAGFSFEYVSRVDLLEKSESARCPALLLEGLMAIDGGSTAQKPNADRSM